MEKKYNGLSGYMFLFLELVILAAIIFGFIRGMIIPSAILVAVFLLRQLVLLLSIQTKVVL